MRVNRAKAKRGSQKWLQRAVNHTPAVLDAFILPRLEGASHVSWRSPLLDDNLAESRDSEFLRCIGAEHLASDLLKFWPRRGPQWDGLAVSNAGDILLVEAKAHIGELCSPSTQASPSSRKMIEKSFKETTSYVRAKPCAPWSGTFYQLANRLAHLYFLRKHELKARLVLVNFVGDDDMNGPKSELEWSAAYHVVWHVLGMPRRNRLAPYVIEIFPDVRCLASPDKSAYPAPTTQANSGITAYRTP